MSNNNIIDLKKINFNRHFQNLFETVFFKGLSNFDTLIILDYICQILQSLLKYIYLSFDAKIPESHARIYSCVLPSFDLKKQA